MVTIPGWLKDNSRKPLIPGIEIVRKRPEPPSEKSVAALMADIVAVCERHKLWLAHEDAHGGFLVQRGVTRNWLSDARGVADSVNEFLHSEGLEE